MARVALFAVAGLLFGSFLTVVIHRAPRRESVARGRSRCPACGTEIRARDNVPVVSWLLLRGRCHACGERISWEYPATELLTAALFAAVAFTFRDAFVAGVLAVFAAVLFALAIVDVRHRILPNSIVYPSALLFAGALVLGVLLGRPLDLAGAALGLAILGGGLFAIALVRPNAMGMGDVKLAALIGLVLGSLGLRYVAVAAAGAILAGGVGGVAALAAGRSRKSAIPFGPFLAAGAMAALFWGPAVADAYLSRLR